MMTLCTGHFKVIIYRCKNVSDSQKQLPVTSTTFLSVFSRPWGHTNPAILMDAKQWALILLLFLLSGPYVFDGLRTTQ